MEYHIYILRSVKLDRFYIGSTSDLETRLEFHKTSPGYKFTGKAADWELFFKTICSDKKQAMLIEKHIKNMKSKKYIENLQRYPDIMEKLKIKYS